MLRVVSGPAGEFSCSPPWESVEFTAEAADVLGVSTTRRRADDVGTGGASLARLIAGAVRTGEPLVATHPHLRDDGSPRILATRVDVVPGPRGAPAAVRGRVHDVTDHLDPTPARGSARADVLDVGDAVVVVARGEIDMAAHAEFGAALRTAVGRGAAGDVFVDARDVGFCDVRTAAGLVDAAAALDPGRRLVLLDPPPVVHRILALLGSGTAAHPVVVRVLGRPPG